VATGAHYPGDVFAGFGIGAGIAVLGARVVPPIVVTKIPAADPLLVDTGERPDGAGVVLVVNPASGGGTGARVIDEVRESLPRTEIVELGARDDVEQALHKAADRAEVLAVAGGDGTVSCAAGVAVEAGVPLAVFPGGTFNHFAKDIGCDTVGTAVDAIRHGSVACVDLVCLNERRQAAGGPVCDAPHAAPRRARAHRLRQQDAADLAVLSRQFDVSAVRIRTVAADPNR
jgi:undecaprenyl-diphosphatase